MLTKERGFLITYFNLK